MTERSAAVSDSAELPLAPVLLLALEPELFVLLPPIAAAAVEDGTEADPVGTAAGSFAVDAVVDIVDVDADASSGAAAS